MTSPDTETSPPANTFRRFFGRAWFGPAVLALLFLLVLGGLLWLIQTRTFQTDQADLSGSIRTAQESVHLRLHATRDYLVMLAEDMARGAVTEELFVRRVGHYMGEHPELVSAVYVDAGGTARWAAPKHSEGKVVGLALACPRSLHGCKHARRDRQPVYSPAHISLQGEPAFDLCVPIFLGGQHRGSIVGVYSCERMLRHMLHREILQNHRASLVDASGNVIVPLPAAAHVDERLVASIALDPPGHGIALRLGRYGGGFWGVGMALLTLLCVGLVTGMSWGMWSLKRQIARRAQAEQLLREGRDELAQRVRERTVDVETANEQLQREMDERRRAEERARQRQEELAHVARVGTMGEMAAGLAHELNQPLGAIMTFAEGGLRLIESGKGSTDALHGALTEVSEQALRAGRIIHRLRSFVTGGEPQRTPHALRQLVEELVDLVAMDIRQEQIDFHLDVPDNLSVLVDGIQTQQVLLNLIRNAVEAMQQVDAQWRSLVVATGPAEDGLIEVTVSDTGPGCPPETLSKMFDAFFSTKEAGIGMGLSISSSIVEAHGGILWATPNTDHGLTVHLTLPIANPKEPDDAPPSQS